jgi:hypothetical protein
VEVGEVPCRPGGSCLQNGSLRIVKRSKIMGNSMQKGTTARNLSTKWWIVVLHHDVRQIYQLRKQLVYRTTPRGLDRAFACSPASQEYAESLLDDFPSRCPISVMGRHWTSLQPHRHRSSLLASLEVSSSLASARLINAHFSFLSPNSCLCHLVASFALLQKMQLSYGHIFCLNRRLFWWWC